MIAFSSQEIILEYKGKKNLMGSIKITNHSTSPAYFKFKVNRPKFYLVKPDRGIIIAGETKTIDFTMHYEGLSDVFNDKFKCFYAFTNQGFNPESTLGFEEKPDTIKQRLLIRVINLPSDIKMSADTDNRNSEFRSTGENSQFKNPSTLESLIRQKQDRRILLKQEIDKIQNDKRRDLIPNTIKPKSSVHSTVIIGMIGIVIGIAASALI